MQKEDITSLSFQQAKHIANNQRCHDRGPLMQANTQHMPNAIYKLQIVVGLDDKFTATLERETEEQDRNTNSVNYGPTIKLHYGPSSKLLYHYYYYYCGSS